MCVGFDLLKGNYFSVCIYLVNQRLHFDVFCLLLLVSLRLAFSSCVTALFLLGLFWDFPCSHRSSSHSRLNASVIQTKLTKLNGRPWFNGILHRLHTSGKKDAPRSPIRSKMYHWVDWRDVLFLCTRRSLWTTCLAFPVWQCKEYNRLAVALLDWKLFL